MSSALNKSGPIEAVACTYAVERTGLSSALNKSGPIEAVAGAVMSIVVLPVFRSEQERPH